MNPIKLKPEEWKQIPLWLKLKIAIQLIWAVYIPMPTLPIPIHFGVLCSLCTFIMMAFVPMHPLAIPIVIGGGLAGGLLLVGGKYGSKTQSNQ